MDNVEKAVDGKLALMEKKINNLQRTEPVLVVFESTVIEVVEESLLNK